MWDDFIDAIDEDKDLLNQLSQIVADYQKKEAYLRMKPLMAKKKVKRIRAVRNTYFKAWIPTRLCAR